MSADKIKKLFSDLSAQEQSTLLFELHGSLKKIVPDGSDTDTSLISKYAAKHQKEYGKDITFDIQLVDGSNLVSVTLHTLYGKFNGVGTNQKIAKINAVKMADDCWSDD